jgi:hypothetical protein
MNRPETQITRCFLQMQVLLRGLDPKASDCVDQGIRLLALQFQILPFDDRDLLSQEFHPLFQVEHLLLCVETLLDFLPQLLFYLLVRHLLLVLVLVPVPYALEAPDRDLGLLLPFRRLFGLILELLDFAGLVVSLRFLFFASNLNLSIVLLFHFCPI